MDSSNSKWCTVPLMVDYQTWFEDWGFLNAGSGGLTPEVIPDGVLWANINDVIIRNPQGDYIAER